jgi:hypothetical protein
MINRSFSQDLIIMSLSKVNKAASLKILSKSSKKLQVCVDKYLVQHE